MNVLGLDLSSSTGYALINDGTLLAFGCIQSTYQNDEFLPEFIYLHRAEYIAQQIIALVQQYSPDFIYIEQTNQSYSRLSQKSLEFIHCIVLQQLRNCLFPLNCICLVNTSMWRSKLQIRMTKEYKKYNQRLKQNITTKSTLLIDKRLRGRITAKHLAVWYVNDKFNTQLKLKDNDIADAICIAYFGFLQQSHNRNSTN